MKPDSNRLVAIDGSVIALVSLAICLWSQNLLLMTVLVTSLIAARHLAIAGVAKKEGVNLRAEYAFWAICTALGAFNDWNSVVNHKIYVYSVPHYFEFSTIPIWMLIFWGMILRFFARIARWSLLSPPVTAQNHIGLGRYVADRPVMKVLAELILIYVTRQAIYRFYLDPIWSWVPFLVALGFSMAVFKPTVHDFKLLAMFLVGGPAIEILYIQVGDLHHYHLGWLFGVPLWIALWWLLIIVIWKDLAFRTEHYLRGVL